MSVKSGFIISILLLVVGLSAAWAGFTHQTPLLVGLVIAEMLLLIAQGYNWMATSK